MSAAGKLYCTSINIYMHFSTFFFVIIYMHFSTFFFVTNFHSVK